MTESLGAISGQWEPGFAPLVEAFAAEVERGKEHGALCVMTDGVARVEVFGGAAAPGQPWRADTLACCFSVTKGVLSLLAHLMIDEGTLGLGDPIAKHWPEFAAAGKGELTVLAALTHRIGLPAVSGPAERGMLYDWEAMTAALAASAPVVPAGAAPVYHNMTYGYLLGEILCRASGVRPLSCLIERKLTGPLGADFHLGLPEAASTRAAQLRQADPDALFGALADAPESLFARSMAFFAQGEDFNSDAWRRAEIGSGNGHATSRAIATLYGQYVWPDGVLSDDRRRAARSFQAASDGPDPILGMPIAYAQGIELSRPPALDFGPNPEAVGHWGAGGATGFADPASGLAFGYVTGVMSEAMGSSARARRYVAALQGCALP